MQRNLTTSRICGSQLKALRFFGITLSAVSPSSDSQQLLFIYLQVITVHLFLINFLVICFKNLLILQYFLWSCFNRCQCGAKFISSKYFYKQLYFIHPVWLSYYANCCWIKTFQFQFQFTFSFGVTILC